MIPERLFYDLGPQHRADRFHRVDGARGRAPAPRDGRHASGHGIGMSLPSDMPLDEPLLDVVDDLASMIGFAWYSEHLSSFATMRGAVPNAQAGLVCPSRTTRTCSRCSPPRSRCVQHRLGMHLLLENPAVFTPVPGCDHTRARVPQRACATKRLRRAARPAQPVRQRAQQPRRLRRRTSTELDLDNVVEIHLAGGSELFGVLHRLARRGRRRREVWERAPSTCPTMTYAQSDRSFEFHESSVDRIASRASSTSSSECTTSSAARRRSNTCLWPTAEPPLLRRRSAAGGAVA